MACNEGRSIIAIRADHTLHLASVSLGHRAIGLSWPKGEKPHSGKTTYQAPSEFAMRRAV
jgi:hypothetical protein